MRLLRDPGLTLRRKLLPPHIEKFETYWGHPMSGVSMDVVAVAIMTTGYFDEPLTRTMLRLIGPGMTIVDVGAHIGYFTLLAAHLVGSSGHVLSLEPTPATRSLLAANTAGVPNITVRGCAAWSEATSLRLRDFGPALSAFNSFTAPRTAITRYSEVQVEAVPLDAELEQRGLHPQFIKIDVESAEREVLEGLKLTLERVRPIIALEVGDLGVPGVWSTADLIAFMASRFGYEALEWQAGTLSWIRPRHRWSYNNLVFLPVERDLHPSITR